jgi:hypothetical protein
MLIDGMSRARLLMEHRVAQAMSAVWHSAAMALQSCNAQQIAEAHCSFLRKAAVGRYAMLHMLSSVWGHSRRFRHPAPRPDCPQLQTSSMRVTAPSTGNPPMIASVKGFG